MNKKIYKDPFVISLLVIWIVAGFFSRRINGTAASSLEQLSIIAFLGLVIYAVARFVSSKRKIKPGVMIVSSLGLAFLILTVLGVIALSAMNNG